MLSWGVGAMSILKQSPQVQHVEQILLTKYSLRTAIPPKDTRCEVCDYASPLALLGGVYSDDHPHNTVSRANFYFIFSVALPLTQEVVNRFCVCSPKFWPSDTRFSKCLLQLNRAK